MCFEIYINDIVIVLIISHSLKNIYYNLSIIIPQVIHISEYKFDDTLQIGLSYFLNVDVCDFYFWNEAEKKFAKVTSCIEKRAKIYKEIKH